MILNVHVIEYIHSITNHEIGLARDPLSVKVLRKDYAPAWFYAVTEETLVEPKLA